MKKIIFGILFLLGTSIFAQLHEEDSEGIIMCKHATKKDRVAAAFSLTAVPVNEVEPNDSVAAAQSIQIAVKDTKDVTISGSIASNRDQDFFVFNAQKGDVIGFAAIGDDTLNPEIELFRANNTSLSRNDDDAGFSPFMPASSPLPRVVSRTDAFLAFTADKSEKFVIAVKSSNASSNGSYRLEIRMRRSGLESQAANSKQIIFLDFDGETINAEALFGEGQNPAVLSPLSKFLPDWGFGPADEHTLIKEIVAVVQENFNDLRAINPNVNVQILNSLDHPDPFGQPNVSRVIVGGTIPELGIQTIGIAQSVDPGNFDLNETAVVLLDFLSNPDPRNRNSVNSVALAPGFSKLRAVALGVGNIVAHEIGHYLGGFHNDRLSLNSVIMDEGGNPISVMVGAGPDAVLGTADDVDIDFRQDSFSRREGFFGTELTDVNAAFAVSSRREGTATISVSAGK